MTWRSRRWAGVEVVVYTRRGCGLCEKAERLVRREAAGASIRLVDVDTDPELQQAHGIRVPVVEVDGREVAELEVAPGQVRQAVRAAARRGA